MRILLEDLFGIDLKRMLLEPKLRIDECQHARLQDAVRRLCDGEPVQYVTGIARFDDLPFCVDGSVLIPRPETEEMVRMILASVPSDRPMRIWDVGTGSGCIAVALAKRLPRAEVIAIDNSPEALAVAQRNADLNGIKLDFVCDDVLRPRADIWFQPVDLVVSNPPYIRESESLSMDRNVLDFEPSSALFVPDKDPLLFYRQIITLAKPQLNPDGLIWFEINEAMGESLVGVCQAMGCRIEVLEDYHGKPRFALVRI